MQNCCCVAMNEMLTTTLSVLPQRCRADKDPDGFFHWAKVASEVSRRSALAEMDRAVVEAIVDEELSRSPSSGTR